MRIGNEIKNEKFAVKSMKMIGNWINMIIKMIINMFVVVFICLKQKIENCFGKLKNCDLRGIYESSYGHGIIVNRGEYVCGYCKGFGTDGNGRLCLCRDYATQKNMEEESMSVNSMGRKEC